MAGKTWNAVKDARAGGFLAASMESAAPRVEQAVWRLECVWSPPNGLRLLMCECVRRFREHVSHFQTRLSLDGTPSDAVAERVRGREFSLTMKTHGLSARVVWHICC